MICKQCGCGYPGSTVGFQALCENCGEYLHTCFNCVLFNPNAERCRSFTTEAVSDRRSRNYCEEFVPNTDITPEKNSGKRKVTDDFETLFKTNGE